MYCGARDADVSGPYVGHLHRAPIVIEVWAVGREVIRNLRVEPHVVVVNVVGCSGGVVVVLVVVGCELSSLWP